MQLLQCIANSGYFQVQFRGAVSDPINYDVSITDFESYLEAISTIDNVQIKYSSGSQVCSTSHSNTISITFLQNHGDLPSITILDSNLFLNGLSMQGRTLVATDGQALGGQSSVRGTKENAVCSNHGVCDELTGRCTCGLGYSSSDGQGKPGTLGDCGYMLPFYSVVD